jgi:hypothetical protein
MAEALERQGIETLDLLRAKLRRYGEQAQDKGRLPLIYTLGLVLNHTTFIYALLVAPLGGTSALLTGMYGIGLVVSPGYSTRVMGEKITRLELGGAIAIVASTLIVGTEAVFRPSLSMSSMDLGDTILAIRRHWHGLRADGRHLRHLRVSARALDTAGHRRYDDLGQHIRRRPATIQAGSTGLDASSSNRRRLRLSPGSGRLSPGKSLRAWRREGGSVMVKPWLEHYDEGVPTMFIAFLNLPDRARYDLTSLRFAASGAAPLPPEVQDRVQAITGAAIVEAYGLTKTNPVATVDPSDRPKHHSVGVPLPDTGVKIVDVETGTEELDVGESGEIVIKGPHVMKGYWNLPAETENALRTGPDGQAGWLYSGDIGFTDDEGYLHIADRKKDISIAGG